MRETMEIKISEETLEIVRGLMKSFKDSEKSDIQEWMSDMFADYMEMSLENSILLFDESDEEITKYGKGFLSK